MVSKRVIYKLPALYSVSSLVSETEKAAQERVSEIIKSIKSRDQERLDTFCEIQILHF